MHTKAKHLQWNVEKKVSEFMATASHTIDPGLATIGKASKAESRVE